MYLAKFATDCGGFLTAAFHWPIAAGALVPERWCRLLLSLTDIDLALRVENKLCEHGALLMLTSDVGGLQQLRSTCDMLLESSPPDGLIAPTNSSEFDAITAQVPVHQIRVDHDGYHADGLPLGCDFRLYANFLCYLDKDSSIYQIHLRSHHPEAECERQVRKYLAWLDIEKPFVESVRAVQRALAQRLLHRGWLTNEYFATDDLAELKRGLAQTRNHFAETTGRIGFREAPIDVGEFDDWLATGCHSSRDQELNSAIAAWGASAAGEEEIRLLLTTSGANWHAKTAIEEVPSAALNVFISYASADAIHAIAICDFLEEHGVSCWIAPRDIERSVLPYTEAIQHGILGATLLVVLISDSANLSVHIPRELDLALERKLAIVPVRLKDVQPAGQLNYLLRTCQWLNAYGRDLVDAMSELLSRVRSIADRAC